MARSDRNIGGKVRLLALAAAACVGSSGAMAFEVDLGDSDLTMRWDNTLKYTAGWRVKEQSPGLTQAPNLDDGDRNFDKGLISNRLDLLSEMDLIYARRYGLRLSGAAWYDQVYNDSNDNPGFAGGAYPNQQSVAYNEFTAATKRLHGRKNDLLDAFVFGGFDLGSTKLNLRAGRHSVLWGESLFFGTNAIAGAMAPVDVIKLLSVPGTQFKEAIRPVPQVSAQWQLTRDISLGAFYQFKWEGNRLPAVGSYFSAADSNPDGAERLLLGPTSAPRLGDQKAKDRGQGGVQLRFNHDETDYGLYLIRFHNKSFQQVLNIGPFGPESYQLAYHQGIVAYGASASRTFDAVQVSAEASIRRNQDLSSSGAHSLFFLPPTNNSSNPGYAVGKTAHVNVSTIWTVPSTPLFREASFVGEVIWNRALSVNKGADSLDPNSTRDAYAMRFQFEPTYRQVLPGLDLGVPVGMGYSPRGSRSRALGLGLPAENGGDMTIGLNAAYLDAWRVSLAFTHYFGAQKTLLDANNAFSYGQTLKDRDFVALSLRRTF
jgi:hypothetical protein